MAIRVLEDLRRRTRLRSLRLAPDCTCARWSKAWRTFRKGRRSCARGYGPAIENHPPGHLHRILRRLDAEASRKIAPSDEQKLIRAIEVCLLAKRRFRKFIDRDACRCRDGAC